MTNRQIETSREVRLWVTQLIVPIATTVIAAGIASPEIRHAVVNKCKQINKNVNNKFRKKEQKKLDNTIFMHNEETGEYRLKRF